MRGVLNEVRDIDTRYLFIGHRLMYLVTENPNHEVWRDVPEHFGRFYPTTVTLPGGKVSGSRKGEWYSNQLEEILKREPINYRIKLELPPNHKETAIIINCLDPIFGHAIYKLAAARTVALEKPNCDVIIVVSRNLVHYATFPSGKVVIEEPLSSLMNPAPNLMPIIFQVIRRYQKCHWAFCNASRVGDQQVLPSGNTAGFVVNERPMVTFVHRDDRVWGGVLPIQVIRVNGVFRRLEAKYPKLETAVVGRSSKARLGYKAHRILITRNDVDEHFEKQFETITRESVCAFGVHGSNMLIPSYNAQSTVELLPYNRLGNAVQAFWPNPNKNIIEVLFTYRVLYGDRFLLSVRTRPVVRMIESLIQGIPGIIARNDSKTYFATASKED